MTWTAPEVVRPRTALVGDERTTLTAELEWQRQAFLAKCAGLTGEQLALRSVEPSTMSLHGLLRHLAAVERWWFRQHFAGEQLVDLYVTDDAPDADFDDTDPARAGEDYATYLAEVALCRKAVVGRSLDDLFLSPTRRLETDLRWLFQHLISEYARHNGHADLLRQCIDGVTGV